MARRAMVVLLLAATLILHIGSTADLRERPTLRQGSRGTVVRAMQSQLLEWGYYQGAVDGVFGAGTSNAVRLFQSRNRLRVDGVVGSRTWGALKTGRALTPARPRALPSSGRTEYELLARVVAAEARNEPYEGQVAVAAVVLNRVADPRFPNSVGDVVRQPRAFQSVTNGLVWRRTPNAMERQAALDALGGRDPTSGAIFFWNPTKPVTAWIWTRTVVTRIGDHVFAR